MFDYSSQNCTNDRQESVNEKMMKSTNSPGKASIKDMIFLKNYNPAIIAKE